MTEKCSSDEQFVAECNSTTGNGVAERSVMMQKLRGVQFVAKNNGAVE